MAAKKSRKQRWSLWMSAWTVLSVPGLCLALVANGPGTIAALAVVVSVLLGVTLIVLRHDHKQRQIPPPGAGWTSRVALCASSLLVSTTGIAAIVPGLALLVVLLAVATAPPLMDLRHRALGRLDSAHKPSTPAEGTVDERPLPREPIKTARTMTDRELCQAWRRSYWTLKDARDPNEKLRLVEHRTRLLDELEARNASALGAWLASGARACDGPDKFFDDDDREQPTAA